VLLPSYLEAVASGPVELEKVEMWACAFESTLGAGGLRSGQPTSNAHKIVEQRTSVERIGRKQCWVGQSLRTSPQRACRIAIA